jgi:MFS family permease
LRLLIDHLVAQISKHWSTRLPFYYGWLIVGIAFVTMAIGVSGRTAFSLLLPPLIDEFKWDRGLAAGAFSFGFLFSAIVSPFVGRVVDARGPPDRYLDRRRLHVGRPAAGALRDEPMAALCHARRRGQRRR